jgi:hypothetical protein
MIRRGAKIQKTRMISKKRYESYCCPMTMGYLFCCTIRIKASTLSDALNNSNRKLNPSRHHHGPSEKNVPLTGFSACKIRVVRQQAA